MTSKLNPSGAFLHLPRTGGTWVFEVLKEANLIACPLGQEHSFGHNEPWAFTVVRNPVDWWASLWRFQREQGWPKYDGQHPLYPINCTQECDLNTWVEYATDGCAGLCGHVYRCFTDHCLYVLKTEQLRSDIAKLGAIQKWGEIDLDRKTINGSKTSRAPGSVDMSRIADTEREAFRVWREAGL